MGLTNLSDEELRAVSLEKNRKGCATKEALRAQQMLRDRHLMDWGWGERRAPEVTYGDEIE